jgi:hypothetical protein
MNSMKENPFSAGNRYSACQEIPCLNPLKAELNPTCHLLALLGAHPIFHISRIRINIKPTRFITTFTKACHWILSCDDFNSNP